MVQQRIRGLRRIARWFAPPELARQLKEFEDNLYAASGVVLAIIDGVLGKILPPRDQLEFRGMVECSSSTDRNIINVIDVRPRLDAIDTEITDLQDQIDAIPPGITDHGALTGLGDAGDHTWATLVNGTRAFTGDQSMGAHNLTNVGQLVMVSAGTVVMNGGSIVTLDDVTCNGTGSVVNLTGGTLVNCSQVRFDDSTPSTPSSGETGVSTLSGLWKLKTNAGHLHDYGVYAYEGADTGVGNFTLNISSIDGLNFTNGVFLVTSTMLISPNPTGTNLAYAEKREWWLWKNFGSGAWNATECHSCQAWNPDSYMAGSFSISGTTLTITKNAWAHPAETTWFVSITARTVS